MALTVEEVEAILRLRDEMSAKLAAVKSNLGQLKSGTDDAGFSLTSFGSVASRAGLALSAGLTLPIVAVGGFISKLGIDAVESRNLIEVSFGEMTAAADAWAANLSDSLGLNRFETEKMAGTLFNMVTSMGFAKDAAFDMSTGMVQLAADMSSFRNIPMEEALTKIRAGLVGETEPLKAIGILVDEATTKTEAYRIGLADVGEELTAQQKIQARWSAILRQTSNDQGDLARTLESPANQLRIMRSRVEEAATSLGVSLIPIISQVTSFLTSMVPSVESAVKWFTALPAPVKTGAIAVLALVAAIGPVLLMIGGMASGLSALIPIVGAMGAAIGVVVSGPLASVVIAVAAAVAAFKVMQQAILLLREETQRMEDVAVENATHMRALADASNVAKRPIADLAEAQRILTVYAAGLRAEAGPFKGAMEGASIVIGNFAKNTKGAIDPLAQMTAEAKKAATEGTKPLTVAQGELVSALNRTGLSASEIAKKMKELPPAMQASEVQIKAFLDAEKDATAETKKFTDGLAALVNKAAELLSQGRMYEQALRAIGGATKLTKDEKEEYAKVFQTVIDKYKAMGPTGKPVVDHFRDLLAAVQAVLPIAQSYAGVMQLMPVVEGKYLGVVRDLSFVIMDHEEAMRRATVELARRDAAVKAAIAGERDWRTSLGEISAAFTQLAQASGEGMEGIARQAGVIVNAMNLAAKARTDLKNASLSSKEGISNLISGVLGTVGAFQQATSSGSKLMSTVGGAAVGFQIAGPWGAAAGAVAGFVKSLFGISEGRKQLLAANQEIEKLKTNLIDTYGGMANLSQIARMVGVDVIGAWSSQNVQGLKDFKALIGELDAKYRVLLATLDEYNLKVDESGQIVARNKIAEDLAKVVEQYRILTQAGADHNLILTAMAGRMNEVIAAGFRAGEQIPLELLKIALEMANLGTLTDAAARAILGLTDASVVDFKEMEDAAKRYGIQLSDLGPAFQQAKLDDAFNKIVADFKLMEKGGADVGAVLAGMSDEIQDLVTDALKFGAKIPEAMKPLIANLIEAGKLTDLEGNKLMDMGGLNFADPIAANLDDVIVKLQELIDAFTQTAGIAGETTGDTASSVDGVGSSVSDVSSLLDSQQSVWNAWARNAVAKANEVKSAVDEISFGSSPGGIKQIFTELGTASAAFRGFVGNVSGLHRFGMEVTAFADRLKLPGNVAFAGPPSGFGLRDGTTTGIPRGFSFSGSRRPAAVDIQQPIQIVLDRRVVTELLAETVLK